MPLLTTHAQAEIARAHAIRKRLEITMDREAWERVKEIFAAARELPAAARPDFLTEACAGDPAVRREVNPCSPRSPGSGRAFWRSRPPERRSVSSSTAEP